LPYVAGEDAGLPQLLKFVEEAAKYKILVVLAIEQYPGNPTEFPDRMEKFSSKKELREQLLEDMKKLLLKFRDYPNFAGISPINPPPYMSPSQLETYYEELYTGISLSAPRALAFFSTSHYTSELSRSNFIPKKANAVIEPRFPPLPNSTMFGNLQDFFDMWRGKMTKQLKALKTKNLVIIGEYSLSLPGMENSSVLDAIDQRKQFRDVQFDAFAAADGQFFWTYQMASNISSNGTNRTITKPNFGAFDVRNAADERLIELREMDQKRQHHRQGQRS